MSTKAATQADVEAAQQVITRALNPGEYGLMTTVSEGGRPHATWMGAFAVDSWREIVTITSPDSKKVENIYANPMVEWLLMTPNNQALVYLEGSAHIVEDPREIKRCWQKIPDKQQAFFLQYFNSGIGFAVIKTWVESICYCVPTENRKATISPADLEVAV